MASQKVKLEICGSSYVVSTNDTEEYLQGLAERLDRDMNQVMIDSPSASVAAAAVITALAYLDEAEKNAFSADNMRVQIQNYLEDASKARMMTEEYKKEVEKLRREVAHYENQAAGRNAARRKNEPLLDYGQNKEAPQQADASGPIEQVEGQMGINDFEG